MSTPRYRGTQSGPSLAQVAQLVESVASDVRDLKGEIKGIIDGNAAGKDWAYREHEVLRGIDGSQRVQIENHEARIGVMEKSPSNAREGMGLLFAGISTAIAGGGCLIALISIAASIAVAILTHR